MDLPSRSRWYDYSRARDMMLNATDTKDAPWHIVRSDDKRRARLNCIAHLLDVVPYKKLPHDKVKLPKRSKKDAYDDVASLKGRRFVKEKYLRRTGIRVAVLGIPRCSWLPSASASCRTNEPKAWAPSTRLPSTCGTTHGCSRSRVMNDTDDINTFVLVSEWKEPGQADVFFGSREFHIFKGIRILLRDEPYIVLDDVRTRMTRMMRG